jgi:UDP-N-acetylglucosamine--N-acetylmuramyl-(pentapeptide) pyrophosphoryl-undecaprenol N-acetylglucosamine transferase
MNRPVVVAAGGTGGHVFPALAVADVLKERDVPVIWLGTRTGLEARLVPEHGISIHWISVSGLRGKSLRSRLYAPFQLVRSCLQSLALLYRLKPRAVLGMGGFVSGPVGLASWLLRKPLVLHEQNAIAGLTNRYLSRLATRVFSAWPGTFKGIRSATAVGNPIRNEMAAMAEQGRELTTDSDSPLRILVFGGSRGARALNEIVPDAVALLNRPVVVRHQAGSQDLELVRERYKRAAVDSSCVMEFISDMTEAYADADLVICRSGAMTVTELGALSMPSILVPYPHAVDDHQTLNARYLSDKGAAVLLPQHAMNATSLSEALITLIEDRSKLVRMSKAARTSYLPGAAESVADALLEVSC